MQRELVRYARIAGTQRRLRKPMQFEKLTKHVLAHSQLPKALCRLGLLLASIFVACSRPRSSGPVQEAPSAVQPVAESGSKNKEELLENKISNNDNLAEVLSATRPLMSDGYDTMSSGSKLLLRWALLHSNSA